MSAGALTESDDATIECFAGCVAYDLFFLGIGRVTSG